MRVQMVCQFGAPVRGLSPYGDALLESLKTVSGLEVDAVDFASAYPSVLHPAERGGVQGYGELHWARPWTWWRVARRSAQILHIQHWAPPLSVYFWPLVVMAHHFGKRVIVTVHNPSAHEKVEIFRLFEDKLLNSADMLLVHGEAGRRSMLQRLGKRAPEIRVIAHGVRSFDEPVGASARDYARLNLSPDRRYVLLFGNLRGYKGIDVLLSAWSKVSSGLDDVDLVIAGRLWGSRQRLLGRAMARVLGMAPDADRLAGLLSGGAVPPNVVLREGFQTDTDIDALIRVSAMAVFPYLRFSGQSGAACRAAAMGCPVLVSQVGALPDLAIDDTWQVAPGDVDGLARRLADKLSDRTAVIQAASRQLQAVHQYDWRTVARAHAALYRGLA